VYWWLYVRTGKRAICALLVCLLIFMILFVPLSLAVQNAANEARFVYVRALQVIKTGNIMDSPCLPAGSAVCNAFDSVGKFMTDPQVQLYAQDAVSKSTNFIITKVTDTLLRLPAILINVLIMFFATFYLLIDGPLLAQRFKRLLPVAKKHQDHITAKLGEVTYALVYGSLVIAVLQGVLGGLAFWAVGVHSPIIWGCVMAVFALIPFLGTGIIWGPAAIYMVLAGASQGDSILLYKGIGLFLFGLLFISTIDNILKPRIIGNRTGIHPVLVLVGVLGGLAAFGIVGFVIGPLIIAVFKSVISIYETEIKHI
jgi:predicted PurR-regulated permease PerM